MPSLAELSDYYPQQDTTLPVASAIPANIPRVYINTAAPAQLPDMTQPITDARPEPLAEPISPQTSDINGDDMTTPNASGFVNHPLVKQLLGLGGEERYQLWPERIVREALSVPHDVMTGDLPTQIVDPTTGEVVTSPQLIAGAQAMSALAGTGGLAGADASLGSTAFLRPALKYENKIYKAPMGGQHLDALPAHLAEDFQTKAMNGEDINHYNFGFMNHKGQFLSREAALDYAVKEGLVDPSAGQYGALTSTLMADSSKPGTAIEAMAKSNPFYSALEHNVNAIQQGKMTGDQWLGTLANKPGVKPEELDWTGTKEFLQSKGKEPVTKAELQEHLQNNKVELKEVDKGHDPLFENLEDGERPSNTTKYHGYQLPGGPLSRDTEILTNRGWKRIDAVEIGDVVMTRKDEAGILEWQPVEGTPKVYAENLYHFYSQSINMRVTENHQMIAKKRRRNSEGLQRLTAKELWAKSEMLVPLTGVWEGKGEDKIFGFDANDLAELFGWYLAEGSCKKYKEGKNTIQIAQCKEYNPEKCARIEALLDRMGLSWLYYGEAYGIHIKNMDQDLKELFHEQPTSEFKFVPYFLFQQSASVIQSLLDGLILGDGCTAIQDGRLNKTTFFTNSEQLAGDVQILILMIGKTANVRQRPSGLYCVGIKSKEWSSVDEAKFEIAPYNDFAFCVTVENHAIYVRRNGVAAFTGNSNYREKLLTLPTGTQKYNEFIKEIRAKHGEGGLSKLLLTDAERATYETRLAAAEKDENSPAYKSSHWDESNILAHVRMNDRMIDGKKSLHIEEIQSDWHQQGRDKGYANPEKAAKAKEIIEEMRNIEREVGGYSEAWKNDKYNELSKELDKYQNDDRGVPDAPFKKSWHELALKRMIREAAEGGYSRLSWTPGEAQAARYDLSKSIDKLAYDPKTGHLQGFKGGGMALDNIVPKDKLPDFVGKEAADKILNKPTKVMGNGYHTLENADLKVGGEGMKGFYDSIIPKAANKLVEKYGVKVQTGKTSEGHPIHYLDLPDKLKNDAMGKGFPLFSSTHMYTPIAGNPFNENKK